MHDAGSPLTAWESFYVIVGSSAAALTGLQFVVIALLKESPKPTSMREIDAFSTPTIVHFGAVLLISAILSAPWLASVNAALALGMAGASGVSYIGLVIRRMRRQTGYRPVREDWLWHAVIPFIAYAVLVGGAVTLPRYGPSSLFFIAAGSLLLLFAGIHNAWDTVTYIAIDGPKEPK